MKFMVIVHATPESESGAPPSPELIAQMGRYNEELAKAGVLLDGAGLRPSRDAWRVQYDGERRQVVDGPFAEVQSLVAGYTLIQTRTRDEALEWSRRFPNPAVEGGAAQIEVRQLFELEEFGDNKAVDRIRELGLQKA